MEPEPLNDDERDLLAAQGHVTDDRLQLLGRAVCDSIINGPVPGLWPYLRSNGWGDGIDPQLFMETWALALIMLTDPYTVGSLAGEILALRARVAELEKEE